MVRQYLRGLFAGLIVLSGCLHPVTQKIDSVVCDLAQPPRDLQPVTHIDATLPAPTDRDEEKEKAPDDKTGEKDDLPKPRSRLHVPDELLPGGPVPPIRLPRPIQGNEEAR